MFEKDLRISYLLDFYGDVLTERKKEVLDMYYNEDLSLAEIAEQIGISRQGVRELIKKAEDELLFLEEKLGLAKKMRALRIHADNMMNIANTEEIPSSLRNEIKEISDII
ncbi:MAG: winged helix-turn-helix transcriptional regulator [Clostridia bacterium]|nr:winged helix-turn-helix transcriptional regulator [Clostridia bacterium]